MEDMSSVGDDVLNVSASDSEFSGFEPTDIPTVAKYVEVTTEEVVSPKKKKGKSPIKGPKKVKSVVKNVKNKPKKKVKPSQTANNIDLNNLSKSDICVLKEKLGLFNKENVNPELSSDDEFTDEFENGRNLHIQIDRNDISDNETAGPSRNLSKEIEKGLFGSDSEPEEEEWSLPRLKATEKDKPIANSLASLINMACTSQCDIDSILAKHKIPENCDKASPPLVNSEIWKTIDRKVHMQDKYISDVQQIVASSMVPVIKLADILKKSLNQEAKSHVSDILTLVGQAQFHLSVRRRYNIRPHIKKKYQGLCNISMPITTQLFGDDLGKEIKACDSVANVGREPFQYNKSGWRGRGNSNGRPYRKGNGYNNNYNNNYGNRSQPYHNQQRGYNRPYRGNGRNFRGRNTGNVDQSPNEK